MTEERWVCDFPDCGKVFTLRRNMLRHRKLHTEEKKHVCPHPECGRRFHRASDLRSHQLVHEPQNRFSCTEPSCGRHFIRDSDLRSHVRRHHSTRRNSSDSSSNATSNASSPIHRGESFESTAPSPTRRSGKRSARHRQATAQAPDSPNRAPAPKRSATQATTASSTSGRRAPMPLQTQPARPVVAASRASIATVVPNPRPLHDLLPSSLREAVAPSVSPNDTSMALEEPDLMSRLLDFDTDWQALLDFEPARDTRSEFAPYLDEETSLFEAAGLISNPTFNTFLTGVEHAATSTSAAAAAATTSAGATTNTTNSHPALDLSLNPSDTECQRCEPLCDTHASSVLLQLHDGTGETPATSNTNTTPALMSSLSHHVHPHFHHNHHHPQTSQFMHLPTHQMPTSSTATINYIPTSLSQPAAAAAATVPQTSLAPGYAHSSQMDAQQASLTNLAASGHSHQHHRPGCGHPIVRHQDHFDFVLKEGRLWCEDSGTLIDLETVADSLSLEALNGADWELKLPSVDARY